MNASLRSLLAIGLAGLLAACSSSPSSSLGELPRTPNASIEQQLQQATQSKPETANLLRLSAADQAIGLQQYNQAQNILQQIELDNLKPAQQVLANVLAAEIALNANKPKRALKSLEHPSLERLEEMPSELQARAHLTRANALAADNQALAAARQRLYSANLLPASQAADNQEQIWALVASLPREQLQNTGDTDLDGWLQLARISKTGTLAQQQAQLQEWLTQNPQHPAALNLPSALRQLQQMSVPNIQKVALLLPQSGPLASVARALRDGFIAAQLQDSQNSEQIDIQLYDSSQVNSLDAFYQQASSDGVQLVVGPLEKPLVKQLSDRQQLPITTLALNYNEQGQQNPPELFQFGLAAEDEARAAAARAWADGMRSAVALVPKGDWGDRVLAAFRESWEAAGGTLIAAEHMDHPVQLAQQIGDLFQLRQSEARGKRLQNVLGTAIASQPARRQDIDFIFLAATPQQAQQIKPTLAFQYAGDVPVYATSHLYSGSATAAQLQDLEGIRFCETPWLLEQHNSLQQSVSGQWPQAAGSLGRLYAMGADAYTLSTRLTELQSLSSQIEGHTGNLSLGNGQRIQRQLPWAEFRNGQVIRLPDTF